MVRRRRLGRRGIERRCRKQRRKFELDSRSRRGEEGEIER